MAEESGNMFGGRFTGTDPYDFDHWYPLLRDLTFETECIPVTLAEGVAMKQRCSEHQQRGQLLRWGANAAELQPLVIPPGLSSLTERIDQVLKGTGEGTGGGFVRLSNRSPKDAVFSSPCFAPVLEAEIARSFLGPDAPEALQVASDMVAFVRASCLANRVNSGAEAMELLCSSQRILADLTRTLLVAEDDQQPTSSSTSLPTPSSTSEVDSPGEKAVLLPVSCVVRRWYHKIAPEYEFRVFVVAKRVVAITQYYKLAYVQQIAQEVQRIKEQIIRYIAEQVSPRLPALDVYTADLVFDPEDLESIKLIEINNPPPLAGQALFSWDDPADRAVLSGKAEGCEIRVLLTPPDPQVSLCQVYQPLLPLFNTLRENRNPSKPQQSVSSSSSQHGGSSSFLGFFKKKKKDGKGKR